MKDFNSQIAASSIIKGFMATTLLLMVYFIIVSLVSGWAFAQVQFRQFWYFIAALAVGFGIQVGLYTYLKNAIKQNASPKVLAVSGTTSTVAMISCCTHYLVYALPILGGIGIITIISSYQVQLFWVGLLFNFAGIIYMVNKIYKYTRGI